VTRARAHRTVLGPALLAALLMTQTAAAKPEAEETSKTTIHKIRAIGWFPIGLAYELDLWQHVEIDIGGGGGAIGDGHWWYFFADAGAAFYVVDTKHGPGFGFTLNLPLRIGYLKDYHFSSPDGYDTHQDTDNFTITAAIDMIFWGDHGGFNLNLTGGVKFLVQMDEVEHEYRSYDDYKAHYHFIASLGYAFSL